MKPYILQSRELLLICNDKKDRSMVGHEYGRRAREIIFKKVGALLMRHFRYLLKIYIVSFLFV